jgi:O-methyltransferase
MDFDKELRLFNLPGANVRKINSIINVALRRFGWQSKLVPLMNHATIMVSPFQKLNFFHLINNVLAQKIEGEFVELGCFEGQTAILFQHILEANRSGKKLMLYDNFKHQIGIGGDIKSRLLENFKTRKFREPILIEGNFEDTIPSELPEKISFMHIDCGYGGDHELHKKAVLHCLESCYARMSPGAIGVLSDYHDNEITVEGCNSNPGVKMACDSFFKNKPEKMFTLYGGEYSHGYFRKATA